MTVCAEVTWRLSPGSLWGRVEEQSLWSSRQLGEQSPAALLRSLVYLNTKYFGLRTVEQHLRLSFANVYGPDTVHPVTKETTVCIRVPSISQGHNGEACQVRKSQTLRDFQIGLQIKHFLVLCSVSANRVSEEEA